MKEELTNKILHTFFSNSLAQSNNEKTIPKFVVSIPENSNFCIGLVDIIDSTKIVTNLQKNKIATYYEVFLNSMNSLLNRYGGVVIKNIGDSLLFYFPETSDTKRQFTLMSCLECCFSMVEEHGKMTEILKQEGIPPIDYRISMDYGYVSVIKSNTFSLDLVGPPVNMCAKINHQAPVNGIVIGADFYELTKNFGDYTFKQTGSYSVGLKHNYPLYVVYRKY